MRERHTIGAGLKEFDMSADFAENGTQCHFTHGSVGNRTFREDGGTSGERKALQNANEADTIDGKYSALTIGDANPRSAWILALLRLLHNSQHRKRQGCGQGYRGVPRSIVYRSKRCPGHEAPVRY